MERINLTRLRSINRRAWKDLKAKVTRRSFTYAILIDGTDIVATLDDKRWAWVNDRWVHVPQPWMTLRTYAAKEGITPQEAYGRWRKGQIPGAFHARGLIVIPT